MFSSNIEFEQLPTFFEGHSRVLKCSSNKKILICKLKPTLFSYKENGPIIVPGIDLVRTKLNALLCAELHLHGINTSTLATKGELIIMEKHEVPPIEVVVKAALVGSPKHLYKGIDKTPTRLNRTLERKHPPYVRFDWRNPLPYEDRCMPTALADHFINTKTASRTTLKAFNILQNHFQAHELELLDICFFMNRAGNVICGEVSTDNCRLVYTGKNPEVQKIFTSSDKNNALERAQTVLMLLENKT